MFCTIFFVSWCLFTLLYFHFSLLSVDLYDTISKVTVTVIVKVRFYACKNDDLLICDRHDISQSIN